MPEPLSYDTELLHKQANKLLDHVETHGQDHSGHDADLASATSFHHIRIDHIDRCARSVGHDLIENIRELDFVFVARRQQSAADHGQRYLHAASRLRLARRI